VTTNFTAKAVTFLYETNPGCPVLLWSLTRAAVKLSLFQDMMTFLTVYHAV